MTAGLEPDEGGATQAAADMPETLPSAGTFNFRWESSSAREVASATLVLTLGIVGNAILPIPYAFSITGAIVGAVIFIVVGLANRYTCRLLLRGAVASATCDYEGLSSAIGGPVTRWVVEISTVLLLLGTNIGAIIQIGSAFGSAIEAQWPGQATWLTDSEGFNCMWLSTVAVIFPLCMLPNMRMLEPVGAVGSLIVWVLAIVIMVKACADGLPELGSSFPIVGFTSLASIAEAFSLAGFAFYLQAMMMPLLSELSPGPKGAAAAAKAVDITVLGTALTTYLVAGFFGAATYGDQTSSNVLENEWLPGVGTVVLNFLVSFYLLISVPPIVFANVYTMRNWVTLASRGKLDKYPDWVRRLISTVLVLGICLAVALGVPGQSGTVLSFVGATFVCLVSYVFPVAFHWVAYYGRARYQTQKAEAEAELLAELGGKGDPELAGGGGAKLGDSPSNKSVGVGVAGGAASQGALPSPFAGPAAAGAASGKRVAAQVPSKARGGPPASPFDEDAFPDIPEGEQLEAVPSAPRGSARQPSLRASGTRRLLLDLLHATRSVAPQRSMELENALSVEGVDRTALFRQELLHQAVLAVPSKGVSRAVTRAVTRMLTMQEVPAAKEEGILLALLPHYRRSKQRHPAVEALIELVLPAVVLAMGLFFSISTLVLLFQ